MKKKLLIGGAGAAVLVAVAIATSAALLTPDPTAESAPLQTATVTTESIVKTVTGKGTIDAETRASAAFRDAGTVTGIAVTVGQSVTAGQDLATIDPAAADLTIRRAQDARWAAGSGYDAAHAQLVASKNAVIAARSSLAAPPPDSDPAALAAALRDAEAQVVAAEAAIVQATVQVNDADREVAAARGARDSTTLKAPISGVVIAVNGTIGSVTSGGGSSGESGASGAASAAGGLIQIADVTSLVVTSQVAEADIASVAVGQVAAITVPSEPGVAIRGTVASVAPVPSSTDGVVRFPVTVRLTEVPAGVRLGLTALVSITTQEAADVLALPVDAVTLTSPSEGTVELQAGDDPAQTRTVTVTVGLVGTGLIEIRDGLKRDDTVVLPGVERVPLEDTLDGGFGDEFLGEETE